MIFATVPYPRRLRLALALTPPWLPGRLKPFAALKPPWRSSERPPDGDAGRGRAASAGRAAARLRPARRLRRRQRRDGAGARRRGLRGRRAATARSAAARCTCTPAGPTEGRRRAERLAEAFDDVDAIVVNAAGCGSHLKEAELGVRVVDVNELLAELGPRASGSGLPIRVAYQDACHLGHAQGIRDAPRALLRTIPGLELVEPAEQAICCGSAGIYNLVQPAAAAELGRAEGGERRRDRREGVRQRQPGLPRAGLEPPPQVGLAATRLAPGRAARRVDPGRLRRPVVRRSASLTAAPEPLLDRLRQRRRDVAVAANTWPVVRDPREPRSTEQDRKNPPRHARSMRARRARPATSRRGGRCRRGSRGRARIGPPTGSSISQWT